MKDRPHIPRILVIDDLFGRTHSDRRNEERANLCAQYLLEDITGDEDGKGMPQEILTPVAQAVFCRGQTPLSSSVGDTVENDLEGTLRLVASGWEKPTSDNPLWSMVLLDLCFYTGQVTEKSHLETQGMPEGCLGDDDPNHYFGLTLLKALNEQFPDLPVVILSSKPRDEVSREFSHRGALAFLERSSPEGPGHLKDYLWRHGLITDNSDLVLGSSKSLLIALRAARRVATKRRNLLIRGERGTGKDLLARYIHYHCTTEEENSFVIVDSGAMSPNLYGSELFGHKKGAFTGAHADRRGRIVEANGGDLFLDEIGNISPDVQAGLLRILEHSAVSPLGSDKAKPVDVRFLSATNEDIEVRAGTGMGFRLDLLDRLREGGTVFLPPLKERKEDIPLLVEKFVRDAEAETPNAFRREIDSSALEKLSAYDWPGNIRELQHCIFNAVNEHPDVEYLVPVHFSLPDAKSIGKKTTDDSRYNEVAEDISSSLRSLEEILQDIGSFDFERLQREELEGRLGEIQKSCGEFISNYLRATLEATRKPVDRKVQIHPAVKMAMGDPKVSASKAADIIKSLLKKVELVSDPVLQEAYRTALRLRPKRLSFVT